MSQASNKVSRGAFAKNTVMQYGLQIAKYLFPFVTIPYLTRVLGPDVYAIRAYILAAMTFMQIFLDFGFNTYGTRVIAIYFGDTKRARVETTAICIARLLLCVIGAIALVPITSAIPIMAANPVYVCIAYVCVCLKAILPDFVFMGIEKMGIITYRFVVAQAISTFLIIFLVQTPGDLLLVPTFEALAAFVAFAWSWENVLVRHGIKPIATTASKVASVFKESGVYFMSNAATVIISSFTTIMIGLCVEDSEEISFWALSMTAISAIQSLYTPVTNSLYPHMVKRQDFALLKKLLLFGVPAVLAGTAAFALLSDLVMLVLGGDEYLGGSYVLQLVSPLLVFSFPAMLTGFPVLAACGEEKKLTASSIISAVFHVTGLIVLVLLGSFTIVSVAVLRCMTEFIMMILRGIFTFQVYRAKTVGIQKGE